MLHICWCCLPAGTPSPTSSNGIGNGGCACCRKKSRRWWHCISASVSCLLAMMLLAQSILRGCDVLLQHAQPMLWDASLSALSANCRRCWLSHRSSQGACLQAVGVLRAVPGALQREAITAGVAFLSLVNQLLEHWKVGTLVLLCICSGTDKAPGSAFRCMVSRVVGMLADVHPWGLCQDCNRIAAAPSCQNKC